MKTTLTSLIMAATVCGTLLLTSCKSTGNFGTDVQTAWNSDAIQNQLQLIQAAAFTFINGYLGRLGQKSMASSGGVNTAALAACEADLHAKFPGAPDAVIKGAALKAVQAH